MRLVVAGIVVALIGLGAIEKFFRISRLEERRKYTLEYREKFVMYCNDAVSTGNINSSNYHELMKDSNKIQRELGSDGIISMYRDQLAGFQTRNYPIFLNFFNEFRFYLRDRALFCDRINLLVGNCDEALLKHIGTLEEAINIGKKRILNPIFCFSNGISFIVSLPVKVFEWCGIINNVASSRVLESKVLFIIEKLVTIICLLSSIITIVVGWEQFVSIVEMIVH